MAARAKTKKKSGRPQGNRPLHPSIVGEGATEKWYCRHLKTKYNLPFVIKDENFVNGHFNELISRIEHILSEAGGPVICIYDADIALNNPSNEKALNNLREEYKKNKEVTLCESMPSIEYWFILHFKLLTRLISSKQEAIKELKHHLKGYATTLKYLQNQAWVDDLCKGQQLQQAISRAHQANLQAGDHSYTQVYKAIEQYIEK